MDNTGRVEESKVTDQSQYNQEQGDINRSPEETVADLVKILNGLFDPKSLINNYYLTSRARDVEFDIPVKVVYDEKSIKAKCLDPSLIDQALEEAENVTIIRKGNVIDTVRPTKAKLKTNIKINDLNKFDLEELRKHVFSFVSSQDDIITWNTNQSLNMATVVCRDEDIASALIEALSKNKFRDTTLDCSLNDESLYISALDNIQKRKKTGGDYQPRNYYYQNYNTMNPYYFNPMYMNPNPYYQGPGPMNTGNGGQFKTGGYYGGRGGGRGRGGFNKRGGRGGFRGKKNYSKSGDQPSNVEVNDNEFPPLSNEEGTE